MTILVTCRSCQKQYRLPDEWAGRKAKCKGCGQAMDIPAAGAAAPAASPQPAAPGAAPRGAGPRCPLCESPMAGGVCSVCGYTEQASKTLSMTAAVSTTGAAVKKRRTAESDSEGKAAKSSSFSANQLVIPGVIALVVIFVAGFVGLVVAHILAERARLAAHERIDTLVRTLQEEREASLTQSADFDSGIDPEQLLRDGAVKFAEELPYVPTFLVDLEPLNSVGAQDRKRWIQELIQNLPPGTDLSPLEEIPSSSFAYQAAQERLKAG
jgi:hypothetical protein